jgi:hypothetical protein
MAFAYGNAVSGQVLKYRGKLVYNVRNRSLRNYTGFLSPYLPSSLLIYLHAAVRWCSRHPGVMLLKCSTTRPVAVL